MDINIKKVSFCLFFIFILSMLGGCNMDQKNEEQKIVKKAEERATQYFKDRQNLDVVITDHKFGPSDLQSIYISGHVKDNKSKTFNITIQYGGDEYTIGSISTNEELHLK
ncbi:hypothetical protein ACH0R4_RS21575 [Bacillus cytotoxicus]|uniref:hypothetical protein n=1 Tax=Bacillus cereus group sp. BfR-BA-01492 TaxID=2920361 RepID=UPI001F594465|nr:hypothetical protein [Bacillus cereus group sp. BfR-BA-01492]EMA6345220.1 hypothetical protein [Bacillus cytotoxicus]